MKTKERETKVRKATPKPLDVMQCEIALYHLVKGHYKYREIPFDGLCPEIIPDPVKRYDADKLKVRITRTVGEEDHVIEFEVKRTSLFPMIDGPALMQKIIEG